MSRRSNLAVACVALPAMVAAIVFAEDRGPTVPTNASPRPGRVSIAPSRTTEAPRSTPVAGQAQPDDAAAIAYAAMRDDTNPKPRLRLIDDWARAAAPGARLDLLSQALVDPDESVRARAQELFDRQIQWH